MLVLHWGKTMTNDTVKSDNPAFIDAVCKLVDAVIIAQCFPVIGRGNSVNEEHALNCAFAVLREISATAELSSLHTWANKRLEEHGHDATDA